MSGVYLSYPFCSQKCTYCNFSSSVGVGPEKVRYDLALQNEVARHQWLWEPETIYWGGGTPSLMPLEAFQAVMNVIPGGKLREVTLECAPGTIAPHNADVWRACGINRVSLGVQSLVPEE